MYGRLYDWYAATAVCPEGWKLPSKDDFDNLLDFGDVLNASVGWNATLGGYKHEDNGIGFRFLDKEGHWWSSGPSDLPYYANIVKNGDRLNISNAKKARGLSVRCIKK
jgi:hypothetical protein